MGPELLTTAVKRNSLLAYFILVAATEEIGWRGFALPRLLVPHGALAASLILGAVHAVRHWPLLLLPDQLLSDIPSRFVPERAIGRASGHHQLLMES